MKKILKIVLIIIIIIAVLALGINFWVVGTTKKNIEVSVENDDIQITENDITGLKDKKADCILVLGAGVKPDGSPTLMLEDRLEVAVYLYKKGVAPKLLLSGDNGQVGYNETKCMKEYVINHGVKEKDVFLDHAGFSTYESMYRAKEIFDVKTAIIVTQKYHEYRALYTGKHLGLNATGVSADQKRYGGQFARDLREIAARDKDFIQSMTKPKPTYLGDEIPISGSNGKVSW